MKYKRYLSVFLASAMAASNAPLNTLADVNTGIENVNSDMDSGTDLLDSVSDQPLLNDFSTDSSTMDSPNPADFPQEDNFEPAVVETDTPSDTAVDFGTDKMNQLLDAGSDFASDQLQQTYDWDGVD